MYEGEQHRVTIVRDGEPLEVIVTAFWCPPERGARDSLFVLLEPDEPGGWEIDDWKLATGEPIDLTEAEVDHVAQQLPG